jgi:hypothetical protein
MGMPDRTKEFNGNCPTTMAFIRYFSEKYRDFLVKIRKLEVFNHLILIPVNPDTRFPQISSGFDYPV